MKKKAIIISIRGTKLSNKEKSLLSNEKPWLMYIHLEDLHGNALFHLSSDKNKIIERL